MLFYGKFQAFFLNCNFLFPLSRFLNNRNKRTSLSANAVATEQKASKVKLENLQCPWPFHRLRKKPIK